MSKRRGADLRCPHVHASHTPTETKKVTLLSSTLLMKLSNALHMAGGAPDDKAIPCARKHWAFSQIMPAAIQHTPELYMLPLPAHCELALCMANKLCGPLAVTPPAAATGRRHGRRSRCGSGTQHRQASAGRPRCGCDCDCDLSAWGRAGAGARGGQPRGKPGAAPELVAPAKTWSCNTQQSMQHLDGLLACRKGTCTPVHASHHMQWACQ